MVNIETIPVIFTKYEIWLLADFCRHEMPNIHEWKFPPVDFELNKDIALALDACETSKIKEYCFLLTEQQLLVIDYHIRREFKTTEGASGKAILLKVFRARSKLAGLDDPILENDWSYKQAKEAHQNASPNTEPSNDSDEDPDSDPFSYAPV